MEVEQEFLNWDAENIDIIKNEADKILNRKISNIEDLKCLIFDFESFVDHIQENATRIHVKFTANTTDKEVEKKYNYISHEIYPILSLISERFDTKVLESEFADKLDDDRFGIFIKRMKMSKKTFNKENIPINTQIKDLFNKYSKIVSSLTINYKDSEITMRQAAVMLENPDREIREEIWKKIAKKRASVAEEVDVIFDNMVELRNNIALNSNYKNFTDYSFDDKYRFDYNADMCREFHSSIEKNIVPLLRKIFLNKKSKLNLKQLKPWDLGVDVYGKDEIKVFDNINEFLPKVKSVFEQISPEFAEFFQKMLYKGYVDLINRKGKAPGAYQTSFKEEKMPFIFSNMLGVLKDMGTIFHESGHAYHFMKSRHRRPFVHPGSEMAEVASFAMEIFGLHYANPAILDSETHKRASIRHFEGVVRIFPWVAKVDAFQLWVYENPKATAKERRIYWRSLEERFDTGVVDYEDFDYFRYTNWQAQHHIFKAPFYYIEYAIAQLGALQLWKNSLRNFNKTIVEYSNGLSFGGSRSLPELYRKTGIKFDFSEEVVKDVAILLEKKLNEIW
ncbi:MAG: M3 family oligoendopeptidase [Candidatus Muirbacterium halophilum]|nr:M3 family oligoendopeptidase [Candidatus Muirbacterium halophilum]MCK9476493.1 M3 family oligoendopeptidase [Candidatus Muirbacterium halophilum]